MTDISVRTDGLSVIMDITHESGKKTKARMTIEGAETLARRLTDTARIVRLCSCKAEEG